MQSFSDHVKIHRLAGAPRCGWLKGNKGDLEAAGIRGVSGRSARNLHHISTGSQEKYWMGSAISKGVCLLDQE